MVEFTDLSKHRDYSEVVNGEVFKLMIPETCAVDDDRDTCDLSLGLQRYDRQDFVGEGNKLERENKMLMKKQSSG